MNVKRWKPISCVANIVIFWFAIFFVSCGNKTGDKNSISVQSNRDTSVIIKKSTTVISDTTWRVSLIAFRDALYQGNREKLRIFFNFPIRNENNELWQLAQSGDDEIVNWDIDKIVPMSESQFNQYFDRIFPKAFINALLKVKTDSLYRFGTYETTEIKDEKEYYKMYADYDSETKLLQLHLAYRTPIKQFDGENYFIECSEFSVVYYFNVIQHKMIQFKQVRLAG